MTGILAAPGPLADLESSRDALTRTSKISNATTFWAGSKPGSTVLTGGFRSVACFLLDDSKRATRSFTDTMDAGPLLLERA
jgi:hypothetical protein